MSKSYVLSSSWHEAIYERLEKRMLEKSVASERPRIAIIGGQPGAGKSKLIELARELFFSKRNPAIINGDDYRASHPQSDEILKADDKRYAEMTDPDVRDWTKRLFDSAIANRRDIIFEGTLRSKNPIMETINNLHEKNYQVNILVLAVNSEVSRIGILSRYEDQKTNKSYGRWTPIETHNEAYENMPNTVNAIEKESPIDSLRVYNRAGDILYVNIRDEGHYMSPHTNDARAIIINEHNRPLTQDEKNTLSFEIETIEKNMLARGASIKELSEIKTMLRKTSKEMET